MTDIEKIKDMIGCLNAIATDLSELQKDIEIVEADGCEGCAFIATNEWEMPCTKCKRHCKDYWRAKVVE